MKRSSEPALSFLSLFAEPAVERLRREERATIGPLVSARTLCVNPG
jgi:hypothetical protein